MTAARDVSIFIYHVYSKPGSLTDPLRVALGAADLRAVWTERALGALRTVGFAAECMSWACFTNVVALATRGNRATQRGRWHARAGRGMAAAVTGMVRSIPRHHLGAAVSPHYAMLGDALAASRVTGRTPIGLLLADIWPAHELTLLRLLGGEWADIGGGLGVEGAAAAHRAEAVTAAGRWWPTPLRDDGARVCPFCGCTMHPRGAANRGLIYHAAWAPPGSGCPRTTAARARLHGAMASAWGRLRAQLPRHHLAAGLRPVHADPRAGAWASLSAGAQLGLMCGLVPVAVGKAMMRRRATRGVGRPHARARCQATAAGRQQGGGGCRARPPLCWCPTRARAA